MGASADAGAPEPLNRSRTGADRSFLLRTLSAVLFLPLLLYLIQLGSWPLLLLVFLIAVLGSLEWEGLLRAAGLRPVPGWTTVCALAFLGGSLAGDGGRWLGLLSFLLVGGFVLELAGRSGRVVERLGATLLGGAYAGLLPSFLHHMRHLEGGAGPAAAYLAFLAVWGCDTVAYSAGRLWGKRPLWPRVSPAKTWEGAIAGAVGAVLLSLAGRAWFAGFLTPGEAAVFGGIAGVAAQVGDLAESALKRDAGVKDTSAIIPGHGGVLDRFDSLFFSLPILYAYLLLLHENGRF